MSAAGEGKIIKRGNAYRAQVQINGVRHSITSKTRAEVQRKRRELLAAADQGIMPARTRVTVAEFLSHWLEIIRPQVRPATLADYQNSVRNHIVPVLGTIKLTKLEPAHLQELYSQLLDKGLSAKTVRNIHGTIHKAIKDAARWGMLPRNVADIARPPKVSRQELQCLTPEQVRLLMQACAGTRYEALLGLAIATGARQGELLGLRWADIDLQRGVVQITRQLTRQGTFSEPKTSSGKRSVHVPVSTVELLRRHRSLQLQERLSAGDRWQDQGLVFANTLGGPMDARNLIRAWHRILQQAGLPRMPFHSLRHTSASLLLRQGVSPRLIQQRLGHADIAVTLQVYAHLMEDMDAQAAEALAALWS